MTTAPSDARKVPIWACAPKANCRNGVLERLWNPCGFFGSVGSSAKARSKRKKVVRSARSPARRIAVLVGFGTDWSPLANRKIIDLTGTSLSGALRRWGAYATGLPDCETHSVLSMNAWMALAPATVSISGGSFRKGMFSLKCGGPTGTPSIEVSPGGLISDGLRAARALAMTTGRFAGPSRLYSTKDPPG